MGPGFDALGMALGLYAEVGFTEDGIPEGAHCADAHHPATKAFHLAGGEGELWIRTNIPIGRGLGFSGAVRVGGAVAAQVQRTGSHDVRESYRDVLALASQLEGHADNVAASLFGGVVATADGQAVRVPLGFDPAIVVWVPSFTTSTDESRTKLGGDIPFDDAVFNVGRAALLVAALAAGDAEALRTATADRLHQDLRFRAATASRDAMEAALDGGAWCGWLSGSGPTIAAMCPNDKAEAIAAHLPEGASTKILRIDHEGAVVEGG
jgi:homoserine kinase